MNIQPINQPPDGNEEMISKRYDEFFGNGYWEEQYKKHIVLFARGCVEAAVPSPQPLGIDVEELAEEWWDEFSETIDSGISNIEYYTGRPIMVESSFKKLIQKIKAGYAASERINQLESGIKQFLLWLKEKRPSMAGHGAPIMILEDLLDNKTNDLIKETECPKCGRIGGKHFASCPSQSTSEEEKEVKQEFRKLARQMILSGFTETFLQEIFSKYQISKR